MRVVLASRNEGKLRELGALLGDLGLALESQADHEVPSPVEDGLTFIENALIKARAVARATTLPAIADDSGIVVPVLNGAPGIYSARYAGEHGDDLANNAKLVADLADIADRRAYFYCAMCFVEHADDPTPLIATAAWHGEFIDEPRGEGGFGYDPHFLVAGREQTSAELPREEKNALSHRGQACGTLADMLRDWLNRRSG